MLNRGDQTGRVGKKLFVLVNDDLKHIFIKLAAKRGLICISVTLNSAWSAVICSLSQNKHYQGDLSSLKERHYCTETQLID